MKNEKSVSFFDVLFALSHAINLKQINEDTMHSVLNDIKGNRVNISELQTIMQGRGINNHEKMIVFIEKTASGISVTDAKTALS